MAYARRDGRTITREGLGDRTLLQRLADMCRRPETADQLSYTPIKRLLFDQALFGRTSRLPCCGNAHDLT